MTYHSALNPLIKDGMNILYFANNADILLLKFLKAVERIWPGDPQFLIERVSIILASDCLFSDAVGTGVD